MKRNVSMLLLLTLVLTLFLLPAQAESDAFIYDTVGLLSEAEYADLHNRCVTVPAVTGCSVYIVTVDDYWYYGDDVYEVAYSIYHENNFGLDENRNGVLLLLSMAERDYALFVYGDEAEYGLNEAGQICLEEAFLPYFRNDDWYGGFCAYVETAQNLLLQAESGNPITMDQVAVSGSEDDTTSIAIAVVVSFLISLAVVSILRMGMKNVHIQKTASVYTRGKLRLIRRHDQFTHKTQHRTKISSGSSGGSSRSGGGGSGRTGKF